MPPKVIGPYHVLETIGTGGAGSVYRAVDRRSGDTVALKLLSTGPALDPSAARRLAREFETLSDLSHPNVVKVFDTGVHRGYPYLAMELVEGLTLRHYLSLRAEDLNSPTGSFSELRRKMLGRALAEPWSTEGSISHDGDKVFGLSAYAQEVPSEEPEFSSGPSSVRALADAVDEPDTLDNSSDVELPGEVQQPVARPSEGSPQLDLAELNRPERVGRLKDSMLQLCRALIYIHGHGLVHRDLKPSNVMVDEDRLVRLMDFGLARFLADDRAGGAGGRMVGTFRYMAPEQILGEQLDGRTDLYSLGVVMYEMLSGRLPFDAQSPYELWQRVLETEAPPLSELNPQSDLQLSRIAHRLIRKEPDDRFQTAEEVYEALSE